MLSTKGLAVLIAVLGLLMLGCSTTPINSTHNQRRRSRLHFRGRSGGGSTVQRNPRANVATDLTIAAVDLYVECEGTDTPHEKLRKVMIQGDFPECHLEGQRLQVTGEVNKVDPEFEHPYVGLGVVYEPNSESRLVFDGVILRGLPETAMAELQPADVLTAECTVAYSVSIGMMGTGRLLTDCEVVAISN